MLTVLAQEQADYIGVKVEGPFFGGHYRYQDARFIRGCCRGQRFRCSTAMETIAEVVDMVELFADRARVRDDPGMRARSRRTILKSSSIAKNCLRSSSTWTSGSTGTKKVSQIVPNCTVSLGSSQGTNPRTGGHSKLKRPPTKVFA